MKIPLKYPDAYGDKEIGEVTEWNKELGTMSAKITNIEAKKLIESMILNESPISMSCKNEPFFVDAKVLTEKIEKHTANIPDEVFTQDCHCGHSYNAHIEHCTDCKCKHYVPKNLIWNGEK